MVADVDRILNLRLPTQNIVVSLRCSLVILLVLDFLRLAASATGGARLRHLVPHFVRDSRPQAHPIKTKKKGVGFAYSLFLGRDDRILNLGFAPSRCLA